MSLPLPEHGDRHGTVTGYMCLTAFEEEIGGASGGVRIFPSVDNLKRETKCWETCGIVEVKVVISQVIQQGQAVGWYD